MHFFSCQFIKFQLMSFQPTKNSCKQTGSYSHVPFSKLSPWRVPGTTWYHIIFFQHRLSNRHMLCQHAQDVITGRSSVIGFHQNSKCHGWEQRFQSVAGDSTSAAGTVSRHGNHFQMDMFHTWMVTTSEAQRDYEAPQSDCFPHIYSDAVSYISWACLRFAARLQPRDKNWTRPAWSWYWARRSARCCWLKCLWLEVPRNDASSSNSVDLNLVIRCGYLLRKSACRTGALCTFCHQHPLPPEEENKR